MDVKSDGSVPSSYDCRLEQTEVQSVKFRFAGAGDLARLHLVPMRMSKQPRRRTLQLAAGRSELGRLASSLPTRPVPDALDLFKDQTNNLSAKRRLKSTGSNQRGPSSCGQLDRHSYLGWSAFFRPTGTGGWSRERGGSIIDLLECRRADRPCLLHLLLLCPGRTLLS